MNRKLVEAAKAIDGHVANIEEKRGEPLPHVFKDPMKDGAWSTRTVGIPVSMLHALRAALVETQAPASPGPFPALDTEQLEVADLYSGR